MKSPEQQSEGDTKSSTEGVSWEFKFVMIVIAIGVIGLIGKVLGFF